MINDIVRDLSTAIRLLSKRVRKLETQVFSKREIACRVYNSVDFSHNSSGNWLAVTFDSERRDTLGMHSIATNTSRIIFPIEGWYLVGGSLYFEANATGVRGIGIRLGGATTIATQIQPNNGASGSYLSIASLYYFSATDYIELITYQDSGGALAIPVTGNYSPEFWAIKLD